MTLRQHMAMLEKQLETAIIEKRTTDVVELRGRLSLLRDLQKAKELMAKNRSFLATVPDDIRSN